MSIHQDGDFGNYQLSEQFKGSVKAFKSTVPEITKD